MSLTVAELALAIGKEENYVRQHIRRKNLAARKDGRRVFVEEAEAARWAKERRLPFSQTIAKLELSDEVSTRAARMTVLALRAPDGTSINMFTLVRHRGHRSLGPWAKVENPKWHREEISVENSEQIDSLLLYRWDATLAKCQEIVKGILRNGTLNIEGNEILYALERNPRRHWAYQEHTASHQEMLESPFGGHSAEITEYWCFDSETQELWMETLKVAGEVASTMAESLHFPLGQHLDRVGNLVIANAQDAIKSEITAMHGKNLILRVAGNSWTTPPPGAYSATVWACHSGDKIAQRSIQISEPETVIGCEADTDRVGYAIYRNSDGQCIDQYEAYLVKSIAINTTIVGPEVKMNIKTNGKFIKVGTSLGRARETTRIEASDSGEMDQAIRTKNLSYRAWEKDQAARKAGNLARFAPEQVEEAVAYIRNMIGQQSHSEGPIYFADPYFLGDVISEAEVELLTAILSEARGHPLNILCGHRSKDLRLSYPSPLTAQATLRRFTRQGRKGREPAFHDRYLITPAGETQITNSVNGWEKHGVTFNALSHGVYRAEAEKLWFSVPNANGNDVLVEEVDPW